MPDKDERWLAIYEMVVYPMRARGRPPAPITIEGLKLLQKSVKEATGRNEPIKDDIDSRGRYLFLQDMEVSSRSEAAAFVWTLGNQAAAAPVFHNIQGNTLRTVDMKPGEGLAISAHMVIDLNDPNNTYRYSVGLEDIEGVSRSRVQSLFEKELRKLITVSADVGAREKEGPPNVTLDSVPGPLMGESGAYPVEIEVLRLTPRKELVASSAPLFHETKREVVFRPSPKAPLADLLDILPRMVDRLKKEYPDHRIRVRWKRPDETRLQVTAIDATQRAEALLERALTSNVRITDLGFEMPYALPAVERRMVKRILEVLRSRR